MNEGTRRTVETAQYTRWRGIITRCQSKYCQSKPSGRTYTQCSVCAEWLTFANFKSWFDKNYHEGWVIDKDIVIPGNKVYGPEACRFVPHYVNNLVKNTTRTKTDLPYRVKEDKRAGRKSYYAACCNGLGGRTYGPYRCTIDEAVTDYSKMKRASVLLTATRGLREGMPRDVYDALLARQW